MGSRVREALPLPHAQLMCMTQQAYPCVRRVLTHVVNAMIASLTWAWHFWGRFRIPGFHHTTVRDSWSDGGMPLPPASMIG